VSSFTPTRLVRVGQEACRLVDHSDMDEEEDVPIRYAALSHCWGGDVLLCLTTETCEPMKVDIDTTMLSKNFQDAISVTRALRIRYLWIDSLCIIQDDPEDWNRESILMVDVYANAELTISATASTTSSGGCFRERFDVSSPCRLVSSPGSELRLVSDRDPETIADVFRARVENAPLIGRAWAFQERLLSRRILHFCSDMVLFECNTLQASEKDPSGSKYEREPYVIIKGRMHPLPSWILRHLALASGSSDLSTVQPFLRPPEIRVPLPLDDEDSSSKRFPKLSPKEEGHIRRQMASGAFEDHTATRGIRGALDTLLSMDMSPTGAPLTLHEMLAFNQRWFELVRPYSRAQLSRPADRLIAIAGVASLVETTSRAQYLAGLWRNVAPELGLLWRVKGVQGARRQRISPYCAPTWSWASVDGGEVSLAPHVQITKSAAMELHAAVESATLRFQGREVTQARSHLDGAQLVLVGPVVCVGYSPDLGMLSYALQEGEREGDPALDFWVDCEQSMDRVPVYPPGHGGNGELMAMHVLSLQGGDDDGDLWDIYGLVLRVVMLEGAESSIVTVERVGIFAGHGFGRDGLTVWERTHLRII